MNFLIKLSLKSLNNQSITARINKIGLLFAIKSQINHRLRQSAILNWSCDPPYKMVIHQHRYHWSISGTWGRSCCHGNRLEHNWKGTARRGWPARVGGSFECWNAIIGGRASLFYHHKRKHPTSVKDVKMAVKKEKKKKASDVTRNLIKNRFNLFVLVGLIGIKIGTLRSCNLSLTESAWNFNQFSWLSLFHRPDSIRVKVISFYNLQNGPESDWSWIIDQIERIQTDRFFLLAWVHHWLDQRKCNPFKIKRSNGWPLTL